ncbi:hypothetical protein HAX54_044117 [Datura stramonium]|uniref:Uncharacterized protein n=1 Tax=Datura stramonium TaxID=4076 RepID=A0ABS8W447_DATST|nr:hypothetical protein [Datura stramonium]
MGSLISTPPVLVRPGPWSSVSGLPADKISEIDQPAGFPLLEIKRARLVSARPRYKEHNQYREQGNAGPYLLCAMTISLNWEPTHIECSIPGSPARTTRASFPACGSSVLSEALPVTQHGRGGGTAHFRVQALSNVEVRQAPGKSRFAPAPSRPASCSRGGGVLERTTHCCVAPTQGRAFAIPHPKWCRFGLADRKRFIETTAIRESLSMLASGGGLSYGSPAAAAS